MKNGSYNEMLVERVRARRERGPVLAARRDEREAGNGRVAAPQGAARVTRQDDAHNVAVPARRDARRREPERRLNPRSVEQAARTRRRRDVEHLAVKGAKRLHELALPLCIRP
jgi:hypothetical protein